MENATKKIVPESIHRRESGRYLSDIVYGANDGIVTTFAVVSGAAGATLASHIVVILGITNLIADGISMGASNFLALRSRRSFEDAQRAIEDREVDEIPEEERAEVLEIVHSWGVSGDAALQVTKEITKDKKRWVDFMMREELGISDGYEGTPARHGLATAVSFMIAGVLPLLPYVFGIAPENRFVVSIIATSITLFAVGSLRSLVIASSWYRSGFEMLAVGGVASFAAYALGAILASAVGVGL